MTQDSQALAFTASEAAERRLSSPRSTQRQERPTGALLGIHLACELVEQVRAEVQRYGTGARAWMASPGYLRLVGRSLKRARHAGPDAVSAFTDALGMGRL